jgi:hypothetical protein
MDNWLGVIKPAADATILKYFYHVKHQNYVLFFLFCPLNLGIKKPHCAGGSGVKT